MKQAQNRDKSPITRYYHPHLADAWQAINQSQTIILLTHRNPDEDGMGACATLSSLLQQRAKRVETIYPNKPDFQSPLQVGPVSINQHSFIPDLIIACDTANYERLYFPAEFKQKPLINIDHHISNSIKGCYNFVDASYSSTCELLYDILVAWDTSIITPHAAECLLSGIIYDTQIFQIPSTTSRTLHTAADLMDAGACLSDRITDIMSDQNPASIKLWATVLASITITPNGRCAWAKVTRQDIEKCGSTPAHLAGFNNFLARISGIDVTLLFYETEDGMTKVSLRSKQTDVNKVAALFGGGGHTHAAGIRSSKPINELARELVAHF